jgi:hypothetical protein
MRGPMPSMQPRAMTRSTDPAQFPRFGLQAKHPQAYCNTARHFFATRGTRF